MQCSLVQSSSAVYYVTLVIHYNALKAANYCQDRSARDPPGLAHCTTLHCTVLFFSVLSGQVRPSSPQNTKLSFTAPLF